MPDALDRERAAAYLASATYELTVARLLAANGHHAPAVAHAQTSAELSCKAAVYRARGRAQVPMRHFVATLLQRQLPATWSALTRAQRADLRWLEDTYPSSIERVNTRYPSELPTLAAGATGVRFLMPTQVYAARDSKRAVAVASAVLTAIQRLATPGSGTRSPRRGR